MDNLHHPGRSENRNSTFCYTAGDDDDADDSSSGGDNWQTVRKMWLFLSLVFTKNKTIQS